MWRLQALQRRQRRQKSIKLRRQMESNDEFSQAGAGVEKRRFVEFLLWQRQFTRKQKKKVFFSLQKRLPEAVFPVWRELQNIDYRRPRKTRLRRLREFSAAATAAAVSIHLISPPPPSPQSFIFILINVFPVGSQADRSASRFSSRSVTHTHTTSGTEDNKSRITIIGH